MQAQQVSRQNESAKSSTSAEMKKVRKVFDSHLKEFEEDTHEDSSAQIRVDSRMSDQDSSSDGQGQPHRRHEPHASAEDQVIFSPNAIGQSEVASASPPPVQPSPLYTHLDIQA